MLLNDQGRKTYDANGNSLNDTFRAYTWDADGNSHTIGSATLTYDALDRMAEQTTGSANSEIVYGPGGGKLALMNGSTLLKAFVPLTGGATAVYTSSGLAYYRHTDHLGTSRLSSTPTNTVYSDTAYSAFGEPYAQVGADPSFTGQNQDTTAGLYDFLFREHDPNQGRWASPDPLGLAAVNPSNPQSWNRYAYVLNNPMALVDPSGLYPVCINGWLWDKVDYFVNYQYQGSNYFALNLPCGPNLPGPPGNPPTQTGGGGGGGNSSGTPQQPSKTSERLERLKNCALGYYGIDPLSVTGLAGASKWGLIAAAAGGIPKAVPESLGMRMIMQPGSSRFTSALSILSAASGGGALRTVANFGSKWAGPIAIASALIDATAIAVCTASD